MASNVDVDLVIKTNLINSNEGRSCIIIIIIIIIDLSFARLNVK